jgi:glutamate racemase
VAVFDSGLGGLSVLGAVREMFAGVRVDYLADGAFFPYGPRAEDEIRQRVVEVIRAYLRQPGAAGVVVIACNTASTAALGALRGAFPAVRFVGVVPAVKPAALASRSKVIGVLATPGTVRRPYHAALIAQHAVLGCTHYPLLRDALETVAPWPVQWCDSGLAVARQVGRQWGAEASRTPGPWRCFSTRDLGSSERILFQRWGFSRFARLEPISGIASRDAAPDN